MSDQDIGRKIAFHRQRRGLSQREFAPLINRSEAWLSQVERGIRSVKSIDVLENIARTLDVPLAEFAPTAPVAVINEQPLEAIPLRLLLSANYTLRAALDERSGIVDIGMMRRDTERAWTFAHDANYSELIPLLELLLPQLEAASLDDNTEYETDVRQCLARSYHACSAALANLGQFDAAWVAADRAISYAGQAHDPLLMAEGAFRLTLVFQGAGQFDQARYTAETAAEALHNLVEDGGNEALSLYGALHLQLAMVAASTEQASEVTRHLGIARGVAERIGHDRNDYNTEFGPTNVQLHEVAAAVELGDAGTAIRVAEGVDARSLSPERRGRFLIDVARAWTQRRNAHRALEALIAAEEVTPDQVINHRLVKTMLQDLLRMEPSPEAALIELARRADVMA